MGSDVIGGYQFREGDVGAFRYALAHDLHVHVKIMRVCVHGRRGHLFTREEWGHERSIVRPR